MFWAFVLAIGVWAALSRVRGRLTQLEDTVAEQARTLEALERRVRVLVDAKNDQRPPVPAAAVPPVAAVTPPAPTVVPPVPAVTPPPHTVAPPPVPVAAFPPEHVAPPPATHPAPPPPPVPP